MNPYTTLGVAPDASIDEIKAAYRRAAKNHHPDAGGDASVFREIQKAYEILTDPERRKLFDETGVVDGPSPESELVSIFVQLVEKFNPHENNLVALARQSVLRSQSIYSKEAASLRQQASRFKDAAERVSVKSGENPVSSKLLLKASTFEQQAAEADIKRKFGEALLRLLERYEYRTEKTPDFSEYIRLACSFP
jgi:curved DNA-binding protein CbpA